MQGEIAESGTHNQAPIVESDLIEFTGSGLKLDCTAQGL